MRTQRGSADFPHTRRVTSRNDDEARGRAATDEQAALLSRFVQRASALRPDQLEQVGSIFATAAGAVTATVRIADYDHRVVIGYGAAADEISLEGTVAGRVFVSGELCVVNEGHTVWLPLTEDEERIGVVDLTFDDRAPDDLTYLDALLDVLVLAIVSKRRYTDSVLRVRRTRMLTAAAEIQWDLLPPLSSRGTSASICGRLDPAYTTGGDSFDYAFGPERLDFTLLDAVGHGLPAVLKSVAAIGAIRNARREQKTLEEAYHSADDVLVSQFGDSFYVTGVIASLDFATGELHWINAGHPLPILVRDGRLIGELKCAPSMPAGLGGTVREIACEVLQPGDKVLFYTDGVTEARSADRREFGSERLGDLFVRAALDELPIAEIGRRLSRAVREHCSDELADDAATVILDYHPHED